MKVFISHDNVAEIPRPPHVERRVYSSTVQSRGLTIACLREHESEMEDEFIEAYPNEAWRIFDGSLRFSVLADGEHSVKLVLEVPNGR